MNSTESSFPKEVVPPLELLAAECLRTRHYGRLHVVVDLLAIFSRELLETLADEKKEEFVRQMQSDFREQLWREKDWNLDSPYTQICVLIAAELRRLEKAAFLRIAHEKTA